MSERTQCIRRYLSDHEKQLQHLHKVQRFTELGYLCSALTDIHVLHVWTVSGLLCITTVFLVAEWKHP